jgi:FecR protein
MRAIATMFALLLLTYLNSGVFAQNAPQNSGSPSQNSPRPAASIPAGAVNAGDGAAPIVAGKVELVEGDVRVFDNQKKRRGVQVGDQLFEGESVVTGIDGEIHVSMTDEAYIAVRPNTRMRIAQYRANGDEQDHGIIGLLSGSLRSITGWIGKYRPKAYVVRTPTATIGIRGTDHEPKVIPEGSDEGEPGTYDKVNIGGTTLRTPQGSIDVTPNHAAFAARAGGIAPYLLDSIPKFYKPTRNEHLIEGKHEQIQRTLDKRRQERRRQVRSQASPQAKAQGKARQNAREKTLQNRQAGAQQKAQANKRETNKAEPENTHKKARQKPEPK